MFSEEFRQRLTTGKYSRWAVDLTEQQLEALLWMIDEYACRAPMILGLLERHKGELSVHDQGFARAKHALETIPRVVDGERPDLEEWRRRVREVVAEARAVTEDEWPTHHERPWEMLARLPAPVSERKRRLLCAALCRRAWHLFADERSRRAVLVAERYADGLATPEELRAAWLAAEEIANVENDGFTWHEIGRAAVVTASPDPDADAVCNNVAHYVGWQAARAVGAVENDTDVAALFAEYAAQCDLIREVFGNPFRPVAMAPRWRTADVLGLARMIAEDRAFDRLPILADALADAGCDEPAIAEHCLGTRPHAPGCWVLDLVLAAE